MAEYKSKHSELSFYVEGVRKKFSEGTYTTEEKKEIDVLDKLIDAQRVDEPKPATKVEAKPAPKKPVSKPAAKKDDASK